MLPGSVVLARSTLGGIQVLELTIKLLSIVFCGLDFQDQLLLLLGRCIVAITERLDGPTTVSVVFISDSVVTSDEVTMIHGENVVDGGETIETVLEAGVLGGQFPKSIVQFLVMAVERLELLGQAFVRSSVPLLDAAGLGAICLLDCESRCPYNCMSRVAIDLQVSVNWWEHHGMSVAG